MTEDHWRLLAGPLRLVLEGTPAGAAVLDTDLRYRYVNPALARMNGLPAADHLRRTIAEVVPGIDAREDVLRAVLADGRPREVTSSGQTREPSTLRRRYWHGAYHRLQQDGETIGLLGIVLEVTASRQQQHELEQARNRLALLDAAATRIGTTLDMDSTCAELADFLVPVLADVAIVEVLPYQDTADARPAKPGHVRLRRAAVSALPGLREHVRAFGTPGDHVDHQAGSAVPRCLATGRPVIENLLSDEELGRAAPDAGRVAAYRALGLHSALVVPLAARGHPIGAVAMLRADSSPGFTLDDATAALDLVRRAAISLDNARRYTREHSIALDLQRALLADPGEPHPDLDVAFRYLPAGTRALVGGDWYETAALPDGRTLLAIGDVMGHSLEAAVEMSHYQAMLRVIAGQDLSPDRILERMDALLDRLPASRPATCLVAIADPAGGTCRYASAGHLPPAVIHPDGTARLLPVTPGPPLGTGMGGYQAATAPLPPRHTLLLYTDGLVERRSEDIDVSLDRLTRLRLPPHAAPEQLLDAVLTLVVSPAEDDIALLAAMAVPG